MTDVIINMARVPHQRIANQTRPPPRHPGVDGTHDPPYKTNSVPTHFVRRNVSANCSRIEGLLTGLFNVA
jgi:hypothetical protein